MRALVLHEPGGTPRVEDRADPVGDDAHPVVRMRAAAIPPIELLIASGTSYFGVPPCPYVPGLMGVGEADDGRLVLFATTAGLAPGDGSMAELCAADGSRLMDLPDVDPAIAAALGNSAPAAIGALRRARLAAGDTVIVLGASGAVGQVGVQVAKAWGARVVAVARGGAKLARALELGADAAVDATDADALATELADAAAGGAQVVLDPVGGAPAAAAALALAPGGQLVNLGDSAGPLVSVPSAVLRSRSLEVLGFTVMSLGWPGQSAAIGEACALVAEGRLTLDVERVALEQGADGWARQASGTTDGRVVLLP